MSKKTDITHFRGETGDVLDRTLQSLAEGLTGLAASEKKELMLSVGHLFQALRKGQFLSQFNREWKEFQDKGRIKEDYVSSEQHYCCFQEMLEFLDKDSPDKIRFETLKKIFFVAATDAQTEKEDVLPHEYMRVCRGLSSGELIVLGTAYRIAKEALPNEMGQASEWVVLVAKESGLIHTALVEVHEEELMRKRLLTYRMTSGKTAIQVMPYFRLTDLAYEMCEYIAKYKAP